MSDEDEAKKAAIDAAFDGVGDGIDAIQPTISLTDAQKLFDVMQTRDPAAADKLELEVLEAMKAGAGSSEVIGLVLGAVKAFLPFI